MADHLSVFTPEHYQAIQAAISDLTVLLAKGQGINDREKIYTMLFGLTQALQLVHVPPDIQPSTTS